MLRARSLLLVRSRLCLGQGLSPPQATGVMPFTLTKFRIGEEDEGHIASDSNIYITVTGAALLLIVFNPKLSRKIDTIGTTSGVTCILYADAIYILGLACKDAELPLNIVIAQSVLKVEKLGTVADALMSYAKSMNLVHERAPSQLRFLLESFATALILRDGPAALDNILSSAWFAASADVLGEAAVHLPTEGVAAISTGGAAPTVPWIYPAEALGLTIGHVRFAALGLLELAIGARWNRDSRGVSSGMATIFNMLLPHALAGVARVGVLSTSITIPDWVTAEMVGQEVGRVLSSIQPSKSLERMPLSLLDARRLLAGLLTSEASDVVNASNVLCCVDHYPPLITILGGSAFCTITAADAWAQLRALVAALGYTGAVVTAGQVSTMSTSLIFAATGLTSETSQALSPEARTNKVVALIKERTLEGKRGSSSDSTVADDKPRVVGYPVHYQAAVYKLLADPVFVAKMDEIVSMFADGKHPTAIIAKIIQSGYAVLYHPLMGVKDEVPLLPVVKTIADNLRAFGPAFFGQLGFELVMPLRLVAKGTTTYPSLDKMWEVWKTGSVSFDIENDFKYATEAFYSCQKNPASVQVIIPKDQVFSSVTRNTLLLHRILRDETGLYAHLNISGGDSIESVMHAGVEHYNEASLMPEEDRRAAMRNYIMGTTSELSVLRMAAVKRGDPNYFFGGSFVCKYSKADEEFAVERAKLADVASTAQGFRDVGLGHLLPAAIIRPPDIRDGAAPSGVGPPSAGPPGVDAGKAAADKAKADKAAADKLAADKKAAKAADGETKRLARAEATEIGSRAKFTEIDETRDLLIYKMANEKKEAFPITAFRACEEVPDGACMPAWCSRSESWWAYCRDKDHPDHKTKRGGAHAVLPTFRGGKAFKVLLAAGMVALGNSLPTSRVAGLSAAAGVSVRAAPSAAIGVIPTARPDGFGHYASAPAPFVTASAPAPFVTASAPAPFSGGGSAAPSLPAGAPSCCHGAAIRHTILPAYVSPLGVPVVSLAADSRADSTSGIHAFMPIVLADDGAAIGVPGGAHDALFGIERDHVSRDADYDQAAKWAGMLFPGRDDIHPFYLFEIKSPPIVVSGALISDPPPDNWRRNLVVDAAGADPVLAPLVWSFLPALMNAPLLGRLCALGAALGESFGKPSAALPDDAVTGVFGETALDPRQVLLSASLKPIPWGQAVARGNATIARVRRDLSARRDQPGLSESLRAECAAWLSVCAPLRVDDIDPTLHGQCFAADDSRIGKLVMPRMPSVASAPLPPLGPPPPYHRVPSYAHDWDSVFRPNAYAAAAKCEYDIYRYLCELAVCEDPAHVRAPGHFACGPDSYYPWAAALVEEGEVLVRREGRITLLDKSRSPDFTLSPSYAAKMLKHSPDAALRDACTHVGVDFFTKLGGQTVIFPPNSTLWNGFQSVHQSLHKMVTARGWFKQELVSLKKGSLALLSVPGRHAQYFCVPRSYSDEWRMVVNDSHGDKLFTTVGKRVPLVSLNASTGVQFDKALRRMHDSSDTGGDLGAPAPSHVPATADGGASLLLVGKFGRSARARVRPAMMSAQAISARPPYRVPDVLPGSGPGAPVIPPEFKPFLFQFFVLVVVLTQCAHILGDEVVVSGDDFSKFFHQLALAIRQAPFAQLMALDPSAVTPEMMGRALSDVLGVVQMALVMSFCVSMGTSPSSSYAQRYLTEFCNAFTDKFHREHLPLYEQWAAESPRFAEWWQVRKRVAWETGLPGQDHLCCSLAYTDDPETAMLGRLVADYCCSWGPECDDAGLIRGDVSKRHLGVQGSWVGFGFFSTGLLGYISPAKHEKARTGLALARSGRAAYSEMRELGGFLHHIVFNMLLPKHVMYNFYDGVDRLRRERAATAAGVPGGLRGLFVFGGPSQGESSIDAICRDRGVDPRNIDRVNGASFDLLGAELRSSILMDIEAGVYSFVVWAAPCRSFSIRGRKLRSRAEPRGIQPIPRAWATYLRNDTLLARFVIKGARLCDKQDILWLCEHPSPRFDRSSHAYWEAFADWGTIWDEPDMEPLLSSASVDWFDFAQCFLGSEYQKYTRLIGHRLFIAGLRGPLHAGEKCVCRSHAKVASGVNALGEYNSRGAAHYPLAMKAAIVSVGATAVRAQRGRGSRLVSSAGELPDAAVVPVTARADAAFAAWEEALASRTGSSMLAAVFHSRPAAGQVRHRIRSDAATDAIVKGTADPGITACYLGHHVTVRLAGTGWGVLPIVALEFGGQGALGLLTFDAFLPAGALVVLPGDSLVVPTVMASRARGSRLLVFMHQQFMALDVVQRRLPLLHCAHEYGLGVGMGPCDCGSRGRTEVLEEVLRHQRLVPHECSPPPEFCKFMDEAVAFFHSLAADDRDREVMVLERIASQRAAMRAPPPSPPASPPPLAVWAAPRPRFSSSGSPCCAALGRWVSWVRRRFLSPLEMAVGHSVVCDVSGDGARHGAAPPLTHARAHLAPPPPVRGRAPLPPPPLRARTAPLAPGARGEPPRSFSSGAFFLTVAAVDAASQRSAAYAASGVEEVAEAPRPGPPRLTSPASLHRVVSRSPQYVRPPILLSGHRAPGVWWRPAAGVPTAAAPPPARHDAWVDSLVQDSSPMAIMPDRPEELAGLLEEMRDVLQFSYAASTNKNDGYHLKAWARAMQRLGTPVWRTDVQANSGVDPVGHRRELLLPALAILIMYAEMSPRSHADPAPNPRSVMAKVYGVAREHAKRGIKMAPLTMAAQVVQGMLRRYVEIHGADSLAPSRKKPLTNAIILLMLAARDCATLGGSLVVCWATYFWISVRATFSVLAETGMRKGDVSKATKSTPHKKGRLTFAKLKWRIGGVEMAAPTRAVFGGISDGGSDGCWLTYGALKNDPFGEFFGSKPSWLPYSSFAARNACRSLVELELAAMDAGLAPSGRESTPLFGPSCGVEWHHALLDEVFVLLLRCGAGLSAAACNAFSVHSFRVYLACALYAAGCPPERIMAILRWKSEEALLIYARLNDCERTAWITQSMTAVVDSTTAAHLPRLDADQWVATMRQSAGGFSEAAADADRRLELEGEA